MELRILIEVSLWIPITSHMSSLAMNSTSQFFGNLFSMKPMVKAVGSSLVREF